MSHFQEVGIEGFHCSIAEVERARLCGVAVVFFPQLGQLFTLWSDQ